MDYRYFYTKNPIWEDDVATGIFRYCFHAWDRQGRYIHRIQSEIIFMYNLNLYTAWFGTVDRQYISGLSFGPEKTPPPLPPSVEVFLE
jgi:hypothetical protein